MRGNRRGINFDPSKAIQLIKKKNKKEQNKIEHKTQMNIYYQGAALSEIEENIND